MNYKQLQSSLRKCVDYEYWKDHVIEFSKEGVVVLDGKETIFESVEECKNYLVKEEESQKIHHTIERDCYYKIPENKIINIIKENYENVKVTNNLIETYLDIAINKKFVLDEVVLEIRKLNPHLNLIENRYDFVLNDGNTVSLNEETFKNINNTLKDNSDVIEYMRESKENFMQALRYIEV